MKKIYSIIFLLITSICLSQTTWNFNNSTDGWTVSNATIAPSANALVLTTNNSATSPVLSMASAGVDATNNKWAVVRIKVAAGGPTYLRISYPNATSGRVFKNTVITNNDADFKTYYVDLSNTNWTGTVNDIKLHFRNNDGTTSGLEHVSQNVNVEIDQIQIVQYPEKYTYDFNTDGNAENWTVNNSTATVAGGVITVTPTVGASGKITQDVHSVNTANASYVHITYKNNSALNNQIRFQYRSSVDGFVAFFGTNVAINQSMAGFETVTVSLTGANWTGNTRNFQIIIRDTNNAGNNSSAGTIDIDKVVFDNNPTLSTNDLAFENQKLISYPNPAQDVLFFNKTDIKKVVIYNVNGQKVQEHNENAINNVDISDLNSGLYIAKITKENSKEEVVKFLKKG